MKDQDKAGLGWTVVLRRQPVRLVEGRAEDGYTDAYELVCCDCGDHPGLDYREIPAGLRRIRGPYRFAEGIAAYQRHVQRYHGQRAITSRATRRDHGTGIRPDDPSSVTAAWPAQTVRRQL